MKIQERVAAILGESGIIARKLQNYEYRPEQLKMAEAVAVAIQDERHLVVEAGTGIGKSLAYLVPFIIYAVDNDKRIIISTNTKTLQNQLYKKDMPFLRKSLEMQFNYALCLGSENYLCRRRLNSEHAYDLFTKPAQFKEMEKIIEWSSKTESGIKSDMGFIPAYEAWDNVSRDPDLCLGKNCSYKDRCFYKKAKALERKAHILVTNHSLFFTNLASGGQVLPDFHGVVFDEAHTLEDVACDHLAFEVSNAKLKYLLDSIYNPNTQKGLLAKFRPLASHITQNVEKRLIEARQASLGFFKEISRIFGAENDSKRIRTRNIVFNLLEEPLGRICEALSELLYRVSKEEDEVLIKSHMKKVDKARSALSFILNMAGEGYVYWVEIFARKNGIKYSLFASPIEIAEELNKQLFSRVKPIVLTSATLATQGNFDFIKKRLGIKECNERLLHSPFDYKRNVLLYMSKKGESPSEDFQEFQRQAMEDIKKIIDIMKGRMFILFTSYKMLNTVFNEVKSGYTHLNLLRQGDKPRYELLKDFKRKSNSILLGTATFWQGVDVPGKSLECVVITKLPFVVPGDPVVEARMELIESRGGKPFQDYQIPQAITTFKQGFGRLIRTKRDKGVVAVLDPRINTKSYGKSFIDALPECERTFDIDRISSFFAAETQNNT